ncbi:MAG: hypothetical protein LBI10_05940 [Deltaproteobacteria bacterium]|jgi:hypothetical protein|nr:hypothetical protein [Deltaproteobacteria bacterium]
MLKQTEMTVFKAKTLTKPQNGPDAGDTQKVNGYLEPGVKLSALGQINESGFAESEPTKGLVDSRPSQSVARSVEANQILDVVS